MAKEFRVITVLGPRQAGKTTLCQMAFPRYKYVSLEDPDIRLYASEDPRGFLKEYRKNVILDEVQRVPQLLSYIQTIVDADNLKAQFVLTGSHQLELGAAIGQSLAGRTALLTLLPLSLNELQQLPSISNDNLDELLLNGFMPGKHADHIETSRFYRAYFQTYIERDVRLLINLKDSAKFEKFVRLCAGRIGQLLNQASLANAVGVSSNTISDWISVLEASFIIYRLQPYSENLGKRLIKSPKLYFIDTGLAAWLMGIETNTQMLRDPLRGNLFENLIVMEILKSKLNRGKDPRIFFYRDSHGNEVDLIIQNGNELIPVEIKSSQTWHKSFLKGINHFEKLFGDRVLSGTVVYGGDDNRTTENYSLRSYSYFKENAGLDVTVIGGLGSNTKRKDR
ncbi:MAG: ATP-binding protein [Xanthomonadales bacterium]|nr:ATP-binding protein [Xanthomonadales bacterium]